MVTELKKKIDKNSISILTGMMESWESRCPILKGFQVSGALIESTRFCHVVSCASLGRTICHLPEFWNTPYLWSIFLSNNLKYKVRALPHSRTPWRLSPHRRWSRSYAAWHSTAQTCTPGEQGEAWIQIRVGDLYVFDKCFWIKVCSHFGQVIGWRCIS